MDPFGNKVPVEDFIRVLNFQEDKIDKNPKSDKTKI